MKVCIKLLTFMPINPMYADPSRDTVTSGKSQKAEIVAIILTISPSICKAF